MPGRKLKLLIIDQKAGIHRVLSFDTNEPVSIGRDAENLVVLNAHSVSRKHALIEPAPDGWVIKDCSSLGTSRNGEPLQKEAPVLLENGDTLEFPGHEIKVTLEVGAEQEQDAAVQLEDLVRDLEEDKPTAHIRVMQGDVEQGAVALGGEGSRLMIGRSAECEIRIDDPMRLISGMHAKVERDWAGVFIYDLSRNGVFVNGIRINDVAPLKNGDRVTLVIAEEGEDRPVLLFEDESGSEEPPEGAIGEPDQEQEEPMPESEQEEEPATESTPEPEPPVQPDQPESTPTPAGVKSSRPPSGGGGVLFLIMIIIVLVAVGALIFAGLKLFS